MVIFWRLSFLVHRVGAFEARFDAGGNALTAEFVGDGVLDQGEKPLVLFLPGVDGLGDLGVLFGIEISEREVLEFAANLTHPEAVRDRRVDLERLAGDAFLTLRRKAAQRTHVVEPVRELDQDHADVADHRQQHLTEAFRLPVLGREEVELGELGDAVDTARDLRTELLANLFGGDARIFHDVVQQPGLQADHIHPHVGQNMGHLDGMSHVRLTGGSQLSVVLFVGEAVGFDEGGQVFVGPHLADLGDQAVECGVVGFTGVVRGLLHGRKDFWG